MDYKAIVNLMKEMNQTDLTKIEIEEEGVRICLEKTGAPVYSQPMNYNPAANSAATNPQVTVASGTPAAVAEQPQEDANHKKQVSPMVGTYYSQPSPDKAPFVKVGDKVKKGQTLCIIEAMKLMNEIESEHDGEIVKILINNEDMVEYGQPLFLIK